MSKSSQGPLHELDISVRLRALMREHGLTVSKLSEIAGVSKSAMEKYLAGPSSPRATAVASICKQLETSADWLLFGKPENDELIRRGVHTMMYHIVMQQKGKEVEQFPAAASDEMKAAGHLTDETMKLIAYHRHLGEVESILNQNAPEGQTVIAGVMTDIIDRRDR